MLATTVRVVLATVCEIAAGMLATPCGGTLAGATTSATKHVLEAMSHESWEQAAAQCGRVLNAEHYSLPVQVC